MIYIDNNKVTREKRFIPWLLFVDSIRAFLYTLFRKYRNVYIFLHNNFRKSDEIGWQCWSQYRLTLNMPIYWLL